MINIHSLRFRIFTILFGVLMVLLACQYLFLGPRIKAKHFDDSLNMQNLIADQVAIDIDLSFQQAIQELENIAKLPAILSENKGDNDESISIVNSANRFFNYYFLMDGNGTWLSYPTRPKLVGKNIPKKNLKWVEDTIVNNKTTFLNVVIARIGKLVSGFATPVPPETGKTKKLLRGVFVVSEENPLLSTIKKIEIGENGYAFLVAANGWILAHPNIKQSPDNFQVYDFSKYSPVNEVIQGKSGHLEYEFDDTIWLASYRPIKSTGWGVIVQQKLQDIYAPADSDMAETANFFIISFILTALILIFATKYSLKPLTTLAQSISEGKTAQISHHSKNEISKIANEFNDLFNRLNKSLEDHKSSEQELSKYKNHLEDLVEERTSKLKSALAEVKSLSGLLPICASCKKIRDDQGYWSQIESYISKRSEADFSHSICPDCATELYPDLELVNGKFKKRDK